MAYSPQALANAIQPTATAAPLSAPAAPNVPMHPGMNGGGGGLAASLPGPWWKPQAAPAGPAPASPLPGPPMSMGGWPSSAPQMGQPMGGGNPGFGGGFGHFGGGGFPGFSQGQDGMAHTLSQIGLPMHRQSPGGF